MKFENPLVPSDNDSSEMDADCPTPNEVIAALNLANIRLSARLMTRILGREISDARAEFKSATCDDLQRILHYADTGKILSHDP